MPLVSASEFLTAARENGYGVGGFNTNNLEWTQSILKAAQAKNAPILIQTSEGAAKYMGGYKVCYDIVADLIDSLGITVPVALHLDHGSYEGAKAALAAGYTSIMFDGSHFPFEENITKTKELVALAHSKGASIEAEVGTIGGEEDGIVGSGELADINECVAIAETGIDFLACGIGNIHGPYPENWTGLSFERLQEITTAVDGALGHKVPLVLHGGSGIPEDQIKKAISLGVAKINVNTELQLVFRDATNEYVKAGKDHEGKGYDPRKLLAPGFTAIVNEVENLIERFGTTEKA
ncbi:MAG: fructose-bisphosphate aldolase [Lactobacillales bacterium]|jgi:fructose-bisphosphate aldolase class II|nr:fructose-bisphosphate aldolase [Lactobacillales bacterium]